jgi:hypothetical protein
VDVRWAKKGGELFFFWYKSHVKCGGVSKVIVVFSVVDVSVCDGGEFVGLVDEKGGDVRVDSGYVGVFKDEVLRLFSGVRVHVCVRGYRNRSLIFEEKVGNRFIVRVCCRVEHVFVCMARFMAGIFCRVYGLGRVCRGVVCMDLVYNVVVCVFCGLVGFVVLESLLGCGWCVLFLVKVGCFVFLKIR